MKKKSLIMNKLVVTTGSWPIIPPIKGIDSENILLCKNYNQANVIIEQAKDAKKSLLLSAAVTLESN